MQQTERIKVKTIYPKDKPSFNDWCKEFKVSSMYIVENKKYDTIQYTILNKFINHLFFQLSK